MSNIHIDISSNKNTFQQSTLKYITHAKYGNDWTSLKHFHQYTEIFFVINGHGHFTVDNKTFSISKNDVIIVNPHIYHREDSSQEGALEYIALGIEDFLIQKENQEISYLYQNFDRYHHDIATCLDQILTESQNKEYGYECVCQNLLNAILIKIMRHFRHQPYHSHIQSKTMNRDVRQIKTYLDTHYYEDINLEFLAKQTNLNKYYISHLFKDALGISPINYLIHRRLNVCQSLLKTSSLSVSEISEAVGFASQSYFTQTFKKYTHLTPNQYRKINTKKK